MRLLFCFLLVSLGISSFAQEVTFKAIMPYQFKRARKLALLDASGDTLMTFYRHEHDKTIDYAGTNNVLINDKTLCTSDGDTLAFAKRKKIFLPSIKSCVIEKKKKNGWDYFLNEQKIMSLNYTFIDADDDYHIDITAPELNQNVLSLMQLAFGRFDSRVVMDYGHHERDIVLPIVIMSMVEVLVYALRLQ